jgi:hypothetical protein
MYLSVLEITECPTKYTFTRLLRILPKYHLDVRNCQHKTNGWQAVRSNLQ